MSRTNASADLVDHLFQVSFALQALLGRIAAEHELSIIQVRLLGILRDRQPLMQELAAHLALEKSSLSGLVDRAEARGLVERVPHPEDGRAMTIRMTTRGKKLAATVEEQVSTEVGTLVAPLAKPDRDRLSALLGELLRAW